MTGKPEPPAYSHSNHVATETKLLSQTLTRSRLPVPNIRGGSANCHCSVLLSLYPSVPHTLTHHKPPSSPQKETAGFSGILTIIKFLAEPTMVFSKFLLKTKARFEPRSLPAAHLSAKVFGCGWHHQSRE